VTVTPLAAGEGDERSAAERIRYERFDVEAVDAPGLLRRGIGENHYRERGVPDAEAVPHLIRP